MALDIIFLSYGEPNAEENWERLKSLAPHAKRVRDIDGIVNAHVECARVAKTSNFFVVDADNYVTSGFDPEWKPPKDQKDFVHLWLTHNEVNGMVYGYSGVKCFPKKLLKNLNSTPLDLTTSLGELVVHHEIWSYVNFNTSPFDCYRSGFREAVKLAKQADEGDESAKTKLNHWINHKFEEYPAKFSNLGAIDGKDFFQANKDNPEKLKAINDYKWLKDIFTVKRLKDNG